MHNAELLNERESYHVAAECCMCFYAANTQCVLPIFIMTAVDEKKEDELFFL